VVKIFIFIKKVKKSLKSLKVLCPNRQIGLYTRVNVQLIPEPTVKMQYFARSKITQSIKEDSLH